MRKRGALRAEGSRLPVLRKGTFGGQAGGQVPGEMAPADAPAWQECSRMPRLSEAVRADHREDRDRRDRLPCPASRRRRRRTGCRGLSYRDYLLKTWFGRPGRDPFYQNVTTSTSGAWHRRGLGVGRLGLRVASGMRRAEAGHGCAREGPTAYGQCDGRLRDLHFPDGNASVAPCWCARCPGAIPGSTAEDVVAAADELCGAD